MNLCYYGFCFKKKKNTTWHWCFRCFVYTREGVSLCFCYCCFLLMFVRRKYQKCSCSCSIEVKLTNPDAQNAEPNQFMCWDCWRSIFSISFFLPSPLSPRESARCQYPPLNHKSNGGLLCYFDPIKYCAPAINLPCVKYCGLFVFLIERYGIYDSVPADVSFERHLRDGTRNWELCVWNALSLGQVRDFFWIPFWASEIFQAYLICLCPRNIF